jgi:hypothetical protein
VSRGNNQAKLLEPSQALDDGRARQMGPAHEQAQADRHAPVWDAATGFNNGQVNLDRIAANPGQVAAVEENSLHPIVWGRFGYRDRHDQTAHFEKRFQNLVLAAIGLFQIRERRRRPHS